MTASRSTERRPALGTALAGLDANERLAVIGALVVVASMFLPWYRFPFNRDLVSTGWGAFNVVHAALLLTAGAAALLVVERTRGRVVPPPLHEGTLLIVGGGWSALLILYAAIDRPSISRGGFGHSYDLAYGLAVALAGAAAIALAGVRRRRMEAKLERGQDPGGR